MKPILFAVTVLALAGSPALRAEDAPKPAGAPAAEAAKPDGEKPRDPEAEEQKKRFGDARKKASEDPAVKAALDAARAAQVEASTKLFDKMLELDPSLAPMIDKERSRMAGRKEGGEKREPKPAERKSGGEGH